MKESAKTLFRNAKESHEIVYKRLSELRQEIEKCNNYVELCDYAFAVHESHEYIEDIKKELWKLRESINKKVDELWLQAAIKGGRDFPRSIHTDYVTATPDIKQAPNIPSQKSDPKAYKELMDYLKIDTSDWPEHPDSNKIEKGDNNETIKSEVVKIHWPGLVNLVTERMSAGLPVPPGINISKLVPVYKLTLRKKRDVLDNVEHEPTTQELKEELNKLDKELEDKF